MIGSFGQRNPLAQANKRTHIETVIKGKEMVEFILNSMQATSSKDIDGIKVKETGIVKMAKRWLRTD